MGSLWTMTINILHLKSPLVLKKKPKLDWGLGQYNQITLEAAFLFYRTLSSMNK